MILASFLIFCHWFCYITNVVFSIASNLLIHAKLNIVCSCSQVWVRGLVLSSYGQKGDCIGIGFVSGLNGLHNYVRWRIDVPPVANTDIKWPLWFYNCMYWFWQREPASVLPCYIFVIFFSGRRLTSQGTRDLDRIAGQVRNIWFSIFCCFCEKGVFHTPNTSPKVWLRIAYC